MRQKTCAELLVVGRWADSIRPPDGVFQARSFDGTSRNTYEYSGVSVLLMKDRTGARVERVRFAWERGKVVGR